MTTKFSACALGLFVASACGGWEDRPNSTAPARDRDASEWRVYGGTGSLQFSPLDQIDRDNVDELEVAWTYRSGDVATKEAPSGPTSFQATPILVNGILYFPTPLSRVIALDPATGAERWSFDAQIDLSERYGILASRDVAYWEDLHRPAEQPCARRIVFASVDANLWAMDASSGKLCGDFGDAGRVDLNAGVGERRARNEYGVTSPPLVLGDYVVVGAFVLDNVRTDVPSGVVRAFDVRTGALHWAFDLAPPGFDYATRPTSQAGYALGTPNVWAPTSFGEVEIVKRSHYFSSCTQTAGSAIEKLRTAAIERGGNVLTNVRFVGRRQASTKPQCRRNLNYAWLIVPMFLPVPQSVTVRGEAIYDPAFSSERLESPR